MPTSLPVVHCSSPNLSPSLLSLSIIGFDFDVALMQLSE